ncbi:MAG: hypothetical protein RL410_635 [Actinomycetota bacterium]
MTQHKEDLLVAAIMDVVAGLDLRSTLQSIVGAAVALSHAQYGALGALDTEGNLKDFIYFGMPENQVKLIGHRPEGRGVLGLLIAHPHAVRLKDLSQHPASFGFPEHHPPMKSFLGVPVRVRGNIFGNLYLTEKHNEEEFTQEDEESVTALAAAAGLAIENARLFERSQKLAVYEDRDRIARDLHDLVIQQLFATGMQLEALARKPERPEEEVEKIRVAVDALDSSIKQIRQTIYALTNPQAEVVTLRRRVMHEVEAYSQLLGSTPSITFEGAVDALTTEHLADHLIAALRELLSNAMRHAKARSLSVSVQVLDGHLVLTVSDDGVGIELQARQSGIANLRKRAEELGGSFEIGRRAPSGTRAKWSVPVTPKN